MELSIVMPTYNSKDIQQNLYAAEKSLERISKSFEIILVDDGSTNDCKEKARQYKSKRVKIKGYSKNQGKGYAIKYGTRFAKGDYVAFVDSGRDLDPSQLKKFVEVLEKENADIVVGSKRHPESSVYYPLPRRIMSKTYQILNKVLFNLDVKDTQVGIKLFRNKAIKQIMPRILIKRFAFDLELLVIATKDKMKIVEAPITMRYKFGSTINIKSVFWILWDTAAIFYRKNLRKSYD